MVSIQQNVFQNGSLSLSSNMYVIKYNVESLLLNLINDTPGRTSGDNSRESCLRDVFPDAKLRIEMNVNCWLVGHCSSFS